MTLQWITAAFCLYLITYQLKYLPGDIFHNAYAAGSADLLASALGGFLFKYAGIEKALLICNILGSTGALLICLWGWTATEGLILPALMLLTKLGTSSLMMVVYFGNNHLFPTLFGATSMGICNVFARIATIGAPALAEVQGTAPMWTIFVLTTVSAIGSLFLRKPSFN